MTLHNGPAQPPDGGGASNSAVGVPSRAGAKVPGMSWSGSDLPGYKAVAFNGEAERRIRDGRKVPNMNFHEYEKTGKPGRSFQSAAVASAGASARKAASAMIAEIPYDLSNWLARCFWPADQERVA